MPKIKPSSEQSTFRVSPWRTKKRRIDQATTQESQQIPGHFSRPPPGVLKGPPEDLSGQQNTFHQVPVNPASAPGASEKHKQTLVQEYIKTLDAPAGPESAGECINLPGLAVFLPNGTLRGKSLGAPSEGPSLDITGKQLSSGRDCLRDQDWQVYKLSIKESGKKAVKLLASKTGGDASRLSAPMEMHGTEREDFQIQLRDCSSAARVDFCCSTICDGKQASELILECDLEGATVNFGSYTWQCSSSSTATQNSSYKPGVPYDSDLDA